ncbi:MAG: flippase [Bacteroidaceae bacterium]|nr:flippase [Bacteroidaceae bacterium]
MKIIGKFTEKIKRMPPTVKAAMVYTVASFVTRGIHLITTPLFTRIMSVEQIGVVSNYSTWGSYFSTVVALGLTSGVINIALKDFKNDRIGYIKSSQSLATISAIAFGVVTALIYPFIEGFIGLPWYYMVLLFVTMLFGFSQSFWMSWQRYEYKYKAVGIVVISSSVLAAIGSLIAVIWAKRTGIEDLAFVRVFSSGLIALLFSVPIFIYFLTRKKPLFRKDYAIFSLQLGLPMVVHTFSKTVLSASDRVMINAMEGSTALGLYSVLYTVGSLSLIIWDSIDASYVPYMFEKLDKGDEHKKDVKKVSAILLFLFGIVSLLFSLFAPEMVWIIGGEQYMTAVYVAPPVAVGIFFIAMYNLYGDVLMYYKKTKYVMYCTLTAAVFNVVTNIIFIPKWGYIAAAYTTLASYALLAFIYYVVANKIAKEKIYNNGLFWAISLIVAIACLLCNLLYANTTIRYVVIAIMLVLAIVFHKRVIAIIKLIRNK